MINFIQNESESLEKISTKRLLYLLNLVKSNENEKQILPVKWHGLAEEQLEKFVSSLDRERKGFIELWKIFLFVALGSMRYPTKKDLSVYFD